MTLALGDEEIRARGRACLRFPGLEGGVEGGEGDEVLAGATNDLDKSS